MQKIILFHAPKPQQDKHSPFADSGICAIVLERIRSITEAGINPHNWPAYSKTNALLPFETK
ncbi:MAG TPA: hypothetical protein DER10_00180 [Elusimicrobia bacterium]|nr:MAG: hypothetical protein A2X33_07095 [Elusimicrobia bacterium GWA2_51_34]HCE96894.1 hypothetical protein [Elusimicrobiota bacterium]